MPFHLIIFSTDFQYYMLFAGWEVHIGKNCARGLEYCPRPQAEGRAQDQGPANNVFIFFSLEKYFIRNIFVDFLLQQLHTVRVRMTFRSSKPVLFTEVFKVPITLTQF